MLEGLDLTYGFLDISTHRRRHYFHSLYNTIRVDNESPPDVDAGGFIVDTVGTAEMPTGIREHWKWNASFDHLGQLILIPDLMDENGVHRTRKNLDAKLGKLTVRGSDRCQLSRSDKGEITGIEA